MMLGLWDLGNLGKDPTRHPFGLYGFGRPGASRPRQSEVGKEWERIWLERKRKEWETLPQRFADFSRRLEAARSKHGL